jgi:hypothetical protein
VPRPHSGNSQREEVLARHLQDTDHKLRACKEALGRLVSVPTKPGRWMTGVIVECVPDPKGYRVVLLQSEVYRQGPYVVKTLPLGTRK